MYLTWASNDINVVRVQLLQLLVYLLKEACFSFPLFLIWLKNKWNKFTELTMILPQPESSLEVGEPGLSPA